MPAYIYAGGQYHLMAGQSIVKDGELLPLKAHDQIVLGHIAYALGYPSAASSANWLMTHRQGDEPTGPVAYVTPTGAGTRDGSSWDNATTVDRIGQLPDTTACVYLSEGDYQLGSPIMLRRSVALYGGFPADNRAWAARDAFRHPTVLTGNGDSHMLQLPYADTVATLDGLTVRRMGGIVESATQARMTNCAAYDCHTTSAVLLPSPDNCYAEDCTLTHTLSAADDTAGAYAGLLGSAGSIDDCVAVNCTCDVRCAEGNQSNNVIMGMIVSWSAYAGSHISNCTAINCRNVSDAQLVGGMIAVASHATSAISNCVAVNCHNTALMAYNADMTGGSGAVGLYAASAAHKSAAHAASIVNCLAVNCDNTSYNRNPAVPHIRTSSGLYAACSQDGKDARIASCTAVLSRSQGSGGHTYVYDAPVMRNCVSWHNDATAEYNTARQLTGCAGSVQTAGLALVTGTDNTITRFGCTGYGVAGMQDAGDCPSPSSDAGLAMYQDWLSQYGDWHPQQQSLLAGAGTADADATTDLDGVTRPDPPTMGAYEAAGTAPGPGPDPEPEPEPEPEPAPSLSVNMTSLSVTAKAGEMLTNSDIAAEIVNPTPGIPVKETIGYSMMPYAGGNAVEIPNGLESTIVVNQQAAVPSHTERMKIELKDTTTHAVLETKYVDITVEVVAVAKPELVFGADFPTVFSGVEGEDEAMSNMKFVALPVSIKNGEGGDYSAQCDSSSMTVATDDFNRGGGGVWFTTYQAIEEDVTLRFCIYDNTNNKEVEGSVVNKSVHISVKEKAGGKPMQFTLTETSAGADAVFIADGDSGTYLTQDTTPSIYAGARFTYNDTDHTYQIIPADPNMDPTYTSTGAAADGTFSEENLNASSPYEFFGNPVEFTFKDFLP